MRFTAIYPARIGAKAFPGRRLSARCGSRCASACLKCERQIGLVRVITDYTTFAYLCDVYVLESHQGKGLGSWMMQCVVEHPELQGLRRWHLTTRDAHALYRKVGFVPLSKPERHMELFTPDIYKVQNSDEGRNHE